MPRGGPREGSGRPKGSKNVKTERRTAAIAAAGITPLDYLLNTMRDEKQDKAVRLDAAKAAAPYVHPKLANIDTTLKGDKSHPLMISSTDGNL